MATSFVAMLEQEKPSSAMVRCEQTFKVLLIGDSGVGKSSILLRYTEGVFSDQAVSNIGVDFKTKILDRNDKKYRLQIWDTAGQERFRTMTSSFYRGAQGVLVVFDPTNKESFSCARRWFDEVERNACEELVQMLVCNKVDLKDRSVTPQDGSDSAAEMGVLYQECSAKDNTNIDAMFEELLTLMLEATTEVTAPAGKSVDLKSAVANSKKKKSRCALL